MSYGIKPTSSLKFGINLLHVLRSWNLDILIPICIMQRYILTLAQSEWYLLILFSFLSSSFFVLNAFFSFLLFEYLLFCTFVGIICQSSWICYSSRLCITSSWYFFIGNSCSLQRFLFIFVCMKDILILCINLSKTKKMKQERNIF